MHAGLDTCRGGGGEAWKRGGGGVDIWTQGSCAQVWVALTTQWQRTFWNARAQCARMDGWLSSPAHGGDDVGVGAAAVRGHDLDGVQDGVARHAVVGAQHRACMHARAGVRRRLLVQGRCSG